MSASLRSGASSAYGISRSIAERSIRPAGHGRVGFALPGAEWFNNIFHLCAGPMHSSIGSRRGFALAAIDETDQLAFLAEGFAGLFPDPVNVLSNRACRALS